MKKTMHKRILGLFILIFVFTFISLPNIKAEDAPVVSCTKAEKAIDEDGGWEARYGITTDYDGVNYILKMNLSDDIGTEFKAIGANNYKDIVKFKITGIVNYNPSDEKNTRKGAVEPKDVSKYVSSTELTNGGTISIYINKLKSNLGYNLEGVELSLDPIDFNDPTVISKCGKKSTFHIDVSYEVDGRGAYETPLPDKWKTDKKDPEISQAIDCSKTYDPISFEYGFCQAKNGATKAEDFNKTANNLYPSDKTEEFFCNPEHLVVSQNYSKMSDDEYYRNRKYLYGYTTKVVDKVTYRHNYETGKEERTDDTATCELKCEESVTIEYGPPVAAKAAFCFQYKVKVTSRVSCAQANEESLKMPSYDKLCTPSPYCAHVYGGASKQGGPNEQFDTCVKECDGGKYTNKCSTKCYNQVYGKNKSVSKTTGDEIAYAQRLEGTTDAKVEKTETKITKDCSSCGSDCPNLHYCYNGSKIIWRNGRGGDRTNCSSSNHYWTGSGWNYDCKTDPRYHRENSWGWRGGYTVYSDTGIPKAYNCTDTCSWVGCTGSEAYLNEDTLEQDTKWNNEQYEKLVSKCKAAASCTNKTAYFTISIDYRNGEGKDITYDFPYSNAKVVKDGDKFTIGDGDKLTSKGEGYKEEGTSSKSNTTLIKGKLCTEENIKNNSKTWNRHYCSRGCYEADSEKDLYRAEWTFPGTWENLKSGEISYTPKSGGSWKSRDKYFCVPADAKDVNTKWWNYYYTKKYKDDPQFAANDKYYNQNISNTQCNKSCEYVLNGKNSFGYKEVEKWNIRALARGFGYFAWNIDIKCFYALNNQGDDPTCKTHCKNKSNEAYRVRSVDLKNLFPGKDGQAVNYDSTGRSPGYNWSEYATQTSKDPTYISRPKEYTKWVQKKGNTVYEDANLDYMVTLDKASIQAIKAHLKDTGVKYTTYEGNIIDSSNVSHYRSKLFSNSSDYSLKNVVYPGIEALKCNNIKEHTAAAGYSASCFNYDE